MDNLFDLLTTKDVVLTIFSVCGGFCASLLGGWDAALSALVLFMAVDFITGLIVAGAFQSSTKTCNGALESKAGYKGLARKFAVFLIVAMAYSIDCLMGTDVIRYTVIIGYIGNESISIFENIGLMGVKYPDRLKRAIDVLTDKEEETIKEEESS